MSSSGDISSSAQESLTSTPVYGPRTAPQTRFLRFFGVLKKQIEHELKTREALLSQIRGLTHELPPLGVESNVDLLHALIFIAGKSGSSAAERDFIKGLFDLVSTLTKAQRALSACEKRIKIGKQEAIKLQIKFVASLVAEKKREKAASQGRPWVTNTGDSQADDSTTTTDDSKSTDSQTDGEGSKASEGESKATEGSQTDGSSKADNDGDPKTTEDGSKTNKAGL